MGSAVRGLGPRDEHGAAPCRRRSALSRCRLFLWSASPPHRWFSAPNVRSKPRLPRRVADGRRPPRRGGAPAAGAPARSGRIARCRHLFVRDRRVRIRRGRFVAIPIQRGGSDGDGRCVVGARARIGFGVAAGVAGGRSRRGPRGRDQARVSAGRSRRPSSRPRAEALTQGGDHGGCPGGGGGRDRVWRSGAGVRHRPHEAPGIFDCARRSRIVATRLRGGCFLAG